jgi:protein-S-isoprenylcysteine O-methyltransferase Ste14
MTSDERDHAPIIAPPPLLAALCIAGGFVGRHFKHLALFSEDHALRRQLSIALFAIAVVIVVAAIVQFISHKTHPSPYKPTAAVVVKGVYRFTRNPIYIAFLIVVIGFAVAANSAWFLISAVVLFVLLHVGVVKREERYLSAKFGTTYDDYLRRVRRWL